MAWAAWGDPDAATELPEAVVNLLQEQLGVKPLSSPAVAIGDVDVPASRLEGDARAALEAAVGADQVADDDEARMRHTLGRSTPDLLRLRAGDPTSAPDAVLTPDSHDAVMATLRACVEHRIAVVPFGGGTTVVGALDPRREGFAAVVALDLRRMDKLMDVDDVSRAATLGPGLRGPAADALLAEHGYTLGHFPQSYEFATVGGFAAARSSGQASAGYGRFDENVVGLTVATPEGTLELGRAPKSAAGPDLRQLIMGSEGAFGVITSVTSRVRRAPEQRVYDGWRFGSFDDGATALRTLIQDGPVPTVLRLSDEAETAVNLARPGEVGQGGAGGCLAIAGYEGRPDAVAAQREAGTAALNALGGEALGPEVGEGWVTGRYRGPYLRDALLGAGALAETLETATFWSRIPALYDGVRTALTETLGGQGTPAIVLCHISHVYPTGASLYFTVVSAQTDDPIEQWHTAKAAACDAILAAGGTISHHHAVGTDHRPWFDQEVGPLGIEALRAVKAKLDPDGILNPGRARPLTGSPAPVRSFTALVNPISGDGRAAGRLLPLARQIREAGATVSVEYTRSLEHARAAAREAADRGDVVIAIGGDGLVGHIAGEVVKADGTFAIIAAGRGNDFARQLGLPTENDAIAKLLLEGEPRIVDVLETGGTTVVGSLFAGVDSVTNARVNESRWIPGRFVYPYSALRTVPSWQPVAYEITVDGKLTRANGFTVIAANSGYYGRGIHIAPDARVDDGLLDVVIIDQIARRDLPGSCSTCAPATTSAGRR